MKTLQRCLVLAGLFAVLGLVGQSVLAGGKGSKVGDKAPVFESVDETGKPWKSSDVVGKKVLVVYFYPADFTGGCTKQACGFRDEFDKLKGLNIEVVGVSGDTPKTHAAFKKYHKLPFTLLADEKGEVAKQFGVKVGKGGKATFEVDGSKAEFIRGVTTGRVTFVIDRQGNIAYANPGNTAEDAKKMQEVVKNLQK